jgi:membrane peptidoglycan carboxypeptidase
MDTPKKPAGKRRPGKNVFTTKSGNAIKLNHTLVERIKARRDARAKRRAAYLSTLPKNPFKRFLFRLHPRELIKYWFSRDGAIMALKITGIGIVVCFMLVVGVFAYFRKDLPNINDLSGQTIGGSNTYYDRTGKTILWQDYVAVKRQPVAGDKISKYVRYATVAIEDKDFYKHGAFDVRGIIRAGVNNVVSGGEGVQGGSTISQQLVKLEKGWTSERTVANKIKEIILATEMEREYSKDDILSGYLNYAPYGPVAVGVQVASQDYFGIDAKDLSIAQGAMLAAIPKSPNTYSPYGPRYQANQLVARMTYIIEQMANQKMITKVEADTAKADVPNVIANVKQEKPSLYTDIRAPYFVLAAKDELIDTYTKDVVKRGGWKITTTLDLGLQELAEKQVASAQAGIQKQQGALYPLTDTAFAAIDNKTGQMVALVGGKDFSKSQVNYAHRAPLSPGSTFKPYDYAAFIDDEKNNAGAGSVFVDDKTPPYPNAGNLPGYKCQDTSKPTGKPDQDSSKLCLWDYDFKYPGPLTIRYSLGGSRNVPAIKAGLSSVNGDTSDGHKVSINNTIDVARKMMGNTHGYACYDTEDIFSADESNETQCYASAMIGDGAYLHLDDHVTGLSTLARYGQQIPHTYILEITDSANKTVAKFKQPAPKQIIKADTAYIVTNMLNDPNASYMNSERKKDFHHYKGWEFAVKTGTTNYNFDGLMASWSTQYTVATWIGLTNNRDEAHRMKGFMENMTTPIVKGWMQQAHDKLGGKPINWTRPSSIKVLPAFRIMAGFGTGAVMPSSETDLFPGWYTPPKSEGNSTGTPIDLVSKKLATTCTPELAKKIDSTSQNQNQFLVDIFTSKGALKNTASTSSDAADDVHNCNDSPPSITLTTPDECTNSSDCVFTVATTSGTHPLSGGAYMDPPASTIALIVNDQTVDTIQIPASSPSIFNYSFHYQPTEVGSATVRVQVVDSVLYSNSDTSAVTFD